MMILKLMMAKWKGLNNYIRNQYTRKFMRKSNMNFKLSENFISKYKRKKAPFGFNGLGELVT